MKPYVNKYKTNDPVKDPNDLRGHNQPPGAGVPEYDSKIADDYFDLRVACRMTIPMVDITMIASASRIFMELGRTLREIKRDTTKSKFERVIKAQEAIVSANGTIKFDHGLYEMLGVHSLR